MRATDSVHVSSQFGPHAEHVSCYVKEGNSALGTHRSGVGQTLESKAWMHAASTLWCQVKHNDMHKYTKYTEDQAVKRRKIVWVSIIKHCETIIFRLSQLSFELKARRALTPSN